jgi:hypothetical protein
VGEYRLAVSASLSGTSDDGTHDGEGSRGVTRI